MEDFWTDYIWFLCNSENVITALPRLSLIKPFKSKPF